MSGGRWGWAVAASLPSLAASCTAPQPPRPPEPAAAAPSASASAEAPRAPSVPKGLGPRVLVGTSGDDSDLVVPIHSRLAVRFGGGQLEIIRFETTQDGAESTCVVAGLEPERCKGLRLTPYADSQAAKGWREDPTLALGAPTALRPVGVDYVHLSPGQRVVYASAAGEGLVVDQIDASGKSTPFVHDSASPFRILEVVEVRSGHVAIAFDQEGRASFARIERGESGTTARKLRDLRFADTPLDASNARAARQARWAVGRAAYGPVRAFAALDGKGELTDEVYLVWIEVTPPPRFGETDDAKPRKARRRGAKHQCGRLPDDRLAVQSYTRWQRGGFNEHGCSIPSRNLSSPTVKKELHVTRLSSKGEAKRERVFELPSDLDLQLVAIEARPTPGGIVVDGRELDGSLRDKGGQPPSYRSRHEPIEATTPAQSLVTAAFDEASGEGVVVYRQLREAGSLDHIYARRFDRAGAFTGDRAELADWGEFLSLGRAAIARAGDGWVFATDKHLAMVFGAHNGATHPAPPLPDGSDARIEAVLPHDPSRVELLLWDSQEKRAALLFSAETMTFSKLAAVPGAEGNRPFIGQRLLRDREGEAVTLVIEGGEIRLRDGKGEGPAIKHGFDADAKGVVSTMHHGHGLDAVVMHDDARAVVAWPLAGKLAALENGVIASLSTPYMPGGLPDERAPHGPVLPGGKLVLSPRAGVLFKADKQLAALSAHCPFSFATSAESVVLVCNEVFDDQHPAPAVTLRTLGCDAASCEP